MKKVVGFALFFIAAGMVLMMLLPNLFVGLLLAAIFLILGYRLFFC